MELRGKAGVRGGIKRDLQSDRNWKASCLWTQYLSPKQWWSFTAPGPQIWKEWPVWEADGQFHITWSNVISHLFSFYLKIFYELFTLILMNYRYFSINPVFRINTWIQPRFSKDDFTFHFFPKETMLFLDAVTRVFCLLFCFSLQWRTGLRIKSNIRGTSYCVYIIINTTGLTHTVVIKILLEKSSQLYGKKEFGFWSYWYPYDNSISQWCDLGPKELLYVL